MTPEEVLEIWKPYVKRGVGIKRATKLVETARKSVGIQNALRLAKLELQYFLDQYQLYHQQLQGIDQEIEQMVADLPGANEMLAIKGIGVTTVETFYAETGDIGQYNHPQQVVNLAGLSLKEHSSGTFKGQTRISKRGRKRLRRAIYLAVRPMVAHNPTFKALHHYYTKRPNRPLKKQQSLIALCGKLLRVLFVIGQRQCEFDGNKLLQGIPQIESLQAA
jgi:transposase